MSVADGRCPAVESRDPRLDLRGAYGRYRAVPPCRFDVHAPRGFGDAHGGRFQMGLVLQPFRADGSDGYLPGGGVDPGAVVLVDDVLRGPVVGLLLGLEPGFSSPGTGGVYVLDAPPDAFGGLVLLRGGHGYSEK